MKTRFIIIGMAAIILILIVSLLKTDASEYFHRKKENKELMNSRDSLSLMADKMLYEIIKEDSLKGLVNKASEPSIVYVEKKVIPTRLTSGSAVNILSVAPDSIGDLLIVDRIDTIYIVDTIYKTYIKIDTIIYDKNDIRRLKIKKGRN